MKWHTKIKFGVILHNLQKIKILAVKFHSSHLNYFWSLSPNMTQNLIWPLYKVKFVYHTKFFRIRTQHHFITCSIYACLSLKRMWQQHSLRNNWVLFIAVINPVVVVIVYLKLCHSKKHFLMSLTRCELWLHDLWQCSG